LSSSSVADKRVRTNWNTGECHDAAVGHECFFLYRHGHSDIERVAFARHESLRSINSEFKKSSPPAELASESTSLAHAISPFKEPTSPRATIGNVKVIRP
jgi:hypothetical protein